MQPPHLQIDYQQIGSLFLWPMMPDITSMSLEQISSGASFLISNSPDGSMVFLRRDRGAINVGYPTEESRLDPI